MLYKTEKFPVIILRLFLTYGPGQGSEKFLPQIIVGCLRDKKFPTSQAEQLRDFCFVEDTVSAIHLALLRTILMERLSILRLESQRQLER